MKFLHFLFVVGAAATAVPVTGKNITLEAGDALVHLSDGEVLLMKESEVDDYIAKLDNNLMPLPSNDNMQPPDAPSEIMARGAGNDEALIVPLPDQNFLDWDRTMSSIIFANGADASVSISSGHLIANAISGGGGFSLTIIPSFLSATGKIDYTHTTTSIVTGTITMTIPKGRYGAIVSRPLTNRRRGWVWHGRPGNARLSYWQADSHTDSTFALGGGTLKWVRGVVTTCLGDRYPLPRCHGQGVLH